VVPCDGERPEHEIDQVTQIKPTWVSYRYAQRYTGLSRGTLWKIARAGLVPLSKRGRAARFHLPTLERYMWRGTENSEGAEPPQAEGPKD
jgi:hypothetical protein